MLSYRSEADKGLQFHSVLATDESSLLPKKWVHRQLVKTDSWVPTCASFYVVMVDLMQKAVNLTTHRFANGSRGQRTVQTARLWVPQNILLSLSFKGFYNFTTVLRDIFRNKPTIQNIPQATKDNWIAGLSKSNNDLRETSWTLRKKPGKA